MYVMVMVFLTRREKVGYILWRKWGYCLRVSRISINMGKSCSTTIGVRDIYFNFVICVDVAGAIGRGCQHYCPAYLTNGHRVGVKNGGCQRGMYAPEVQCFSYLYGQSSDNRVSDGYRNQRVLHLAGGFNVLRVRTGCVV